jgi:DNA (cytosine-5)-methyltransferase 1
VTGVDIDPHPSYPFEFLQDDVMNVITDTHYLDLFDVIAASPPCQLHTRAGHLRKAQGKTTSKVDMITPIRPYLAQWASRGGAYIIENVEGAPLRNPVKVCGSSFGLKVRRHRLFESNVPLMSLPCDHKGQGKPVGVYGSMRDKIPQGGHTANSVEEAREAMGIDWMQWRSNNQEWNDLKEAVPPAYTEFLGKQIMDWLHGAG